MNLDDLKEIRTLHGEIISMQERIARLQSAMEKMTVRLRLCSERSTAEQDSQAEQIAKLMELEKKHVQLLLDYEVRLTDIREWMDTLAPLSRDIMRYRYADGLSWAEIAEVMNYSEAYCKEIHGEEMKKIE